MRIGLSGGLAGVIILSLASVNASASGFQLREHSAGALANGMAGVSASTDDVTYMAYNPAALGGIGDTEIAAAGTLYGSSFELSDVHARTADLGAPLGSSIYAGDSNADGAEPAVAPALAFVTPLGKRWRFGVAVLAPWGLATKYDDDWAGRFYAVETSLTTVNIRPTIAFSPTPSLTLAVGAQIQYADATLSNKVDYGLAALAQGVDLPGVTELPASGLEGLAEVQGDDWGMGYSVGALWQVTTDTRVGAAFHSEIHHELRGDARFDADNASAAAVRDGFRAADTFTDTGGSADITTPATASLGLSHQLTERTTLLAELAWTGWSAYDEVVVDFEDSTPSSVTVQQWRDVFMAAAGINYALWDTLTLRGGIGYDESPIPNDTRNPGTPLSDRRWLSFGATWRPTRAVTLSGGFAHVFFSDASIDLESSSRGNAARGDLNAKVDAAANVFSAQGVYRF